MNTEIKNHQTSTKHFIVINPTAEMVAEAKKMVASGSARIEKNGSLTVHNNAKYIFANLLNKSIEAETPLTAEQIEIEKMYQDFGQRDSNGKAY
jgi:hypothetical protein